MTGRRHRPGRDRRRASAVDRTASRLGGRVDDPRAGAGLRRWWARRRAAAPASPARRSGARRLADRSRAARVVEVAVREEGSAPARRPGGEIHDLVADARPCVDEHQLRPGRGRRWPFRGPRAGRRRADLLHRPAARVGLHPADTDRVKIELRRSGRAGDSMCLRKTPRTAGAPHRAASVRSSRRS